jgi:hypothetical protein
LVIEKSNEPHESPPPNKRLERSKLADILSIEIGLTGITLKAKSE